MKGCILPERFAVRGSEGEVLLSKKTPYKKQIQALSEISQAISSDQYLDDILKLIVTVTANVMDSKICSLWLVDEDQRVLRIRATQTISEEYLKERSLGLGEGVVGYVAQQKKALAIPDVLKEPRYKEKELAKKEGLVSMLSVPLKVKEKVIGVINCYTSYPHEFNDTERAVLTTVANQAAVCIENTELIVKTKVIQEELETRKMVERAKGILMKHYGLTEDEAFKRIRRASMDSRKTMRQIAEAILLTEKMGA
jgi:two-component system, response regulator PdtaR